MMYLVGASDKITVEVTATPGTPVSYYCAYKIFAEASAAVVELANTVGTLANTTPADLAAIGALVDKAIAIEQIAITNKDASARTVVLKFTNGTTTVDIYRAQLAAGGQLLIGADGSPSVRTATGALDVP